jgi:hypothetical protein
MGLVAAGVVAVAGLTVAVFAVAAVRWSDRQEVLRQQAALKQEASTPPADLPGGNDGAGSRPADKPADKAERDRPEEDESVVKERGKKRRVVVEEDEPAPDTNYEAWSHKDLLAHLASRGLSLVTDGARRGLAHGPAMYFGKKGSVPSHVLLDGVPVTSSHYKGIAYVQQRKSAREAKDEAGILGDNAFAWHRFLFAGDPAFLKELQKALPK